MNSVTFKSKSLMRSYRASDMQFLSIRSAVFSYLIQS